MGLMFRKMKICTLLAFHSLFLNFDVLELSTSPLSPAHLSSEMKTTLYLDTSQCLLPETEGNQLVIKYFTIIVLNRHF